MTTISAGPSAHETDATSQVDGMHGTVSVSLCSSISPTLCHRVCLVDGLEGTTHLAVEYAMAAGSLGIILDVAAEVFQAMALLTAWRID